MAVCLTLVLCSCDEPTNSHTVTRIENNESASMKNADGYLWKLEVIDGAAEDWYVLMKTDSSISAGTVQSKSKGSPW